MLDSIRAVAQSHHALACLACGKCTGVCPVAVEGGDYSPRRFVEWVTAGEDALGGDALWDCLGCLLCSQVCPSNVDFAGFVRNLRALAGEDGACGRCTHGHAIHTWMRMMADGMAAPDLVAWLGDQAADDVSEADTVYFVGCLAQFEALFAPLGFDGREIARAGLQLARGAGLTPVVLNDQVCCGHDLLWSGDVSAFRALAERNTALLRASGATRVVTVCPECAYTLGRLYPEFGYAHGLEVLHISQVSDVPVQEPGERGQVTYQDPCRLGRYLGEYDAPRRALAAAGFELIEMQDHGPQALCCGTSAWLNCGAVNKAMQVGRLRQAAATGAGVLVTACPKCQIHFRCALDDPDVRDELALSVQDLSVLLASALEE
jgi:heterodisulfide reductase subunit D